MKLAIFLFCTLFLPGIIFAQSPDSSRIIAISGEINTATKSGDFAKAASLAKELISLGVRTNDIYFMAGTTIGLAGDKPAAIAYFDTAAAKGFSNLTNWQSITGMLGIASDPAIAASTETVKKNAKEHPEKKATDVNARLHELYLADQNERVELVGSGDLEHISQERAFALFHKDSLRRVEVYSLLHEKKLSTARDFSEAALILQHGNDTSDFLNAHQLALVSVKLGNKDARWLAAATLDRYLVAEHKPQKYGTQSFTNKTTGKRELYPVDPSVTDKERAEWNCPPLENALKAVEKVYDKK